MATSPVSIHKLTSELVADGLEHVVGDVRGQMLDGRQLEALLGAGHHARVGCLALAEHGDGLL